MITLTHACGHTSVWDADLWGLYPELLTHRLYAPCPVCRGRDARMPGRLVPESAQFCMLTGTVLPESLAHCGQEFNSSHKVCFKEEAKVSVPPGTEGRKLGYVQLKGKPRVLHNRRALYEARIDVTCAECQNPIGKGERFTRGQGMTNVCETCRPWEMIVAKEVSHAA